VRLRLHLVLVPAGGPFPPSLLVEIHPTKRPIVCLNCLIGLGVQVSLLFFAGFLMRFDDMPKWWQWYAYINFLRYAWGAQMINQFKGKRSDLPGNPPVEINGEEILKYYGLDGYTAWQMMGFELLFFVAFFFMAWGALQFTRLSKR
jgi:ATP-binding cassette, subfamily G (WHITE), member 2